MTTLMMKFRSSPFLEHRPSLCSYCLKPVGGLLFHHKDRWYAACSREHLSKIKKQIITGKRNTLKAPMINNSAVIDAVSSCKDIYTKLAKENKSYVIHEWKKDDRVRLFHQAIKEYLVVCTEQAYQGFSLEDDG